MAERHISMRGEVVDFNRLRLANSDKPALGNANMNARGDMIDSKGAVIKTQEQIDAEWAAQMEAQQDTPVNVDLKNPKAMAAAAGTPVAAPQKQLDVDDANFDPEMMAKPRRRIVESD